MCQTDFDTGDGHKPIYHQMAAQPATLSPDVAISPHQTGYQTPHHEAKTSRSGSNNRIGLWQMQIAKMLDFLGWLAQCRPSSLLVFLTIKYGQDLDQGPYLAIKGLAMTTIYFVVSQLASYHLSVSVLLPEVAGLSAPQRHGIEQ